MFAGLFGLNDAEKKKFVRKQERDLRKIRQKVQIQEKNKDEILKSRGQMLRLKSTIGVLLGRYRIG